MSNIKGDFQIKKEKFLLWFNIIKKYGLEYVKLMKNNGINISICFKKRDRNFLSQYLWLMNFKYSN